MLSLRCCGVIRRTLTLGLPRPSGMAGHADTAARRDFSVRIVRQEEPAMTYANRAIYDADSHIMELPDFLQKYADPAIRDEVPAVSYSASVVTDEEVAVIMGQGGRHSDSHIAQQIALGDRLIEKSKEIQAL